MILMRPRHCRGHGECCYAYTNANHHGSGHSLHAVSSIWLLRRGRTIVRSHPLSFILGHRARRIMAPEPPIGDHVELLWTSLSDRLLLGLGRSVPFIGPSADLVLSVGVTFLDRSLEFVVIPFDHHQVVVRKRTPLSFELTFELAPLRFEMLGVHIFPPFG